MGRQRIGFLVLPGFSMMTLSAAIESFRAANLLSGRQLYDLILIGIDDNLVRSSGGLLLKPAASIATAPALDRVFVVSDLEAMEFFDDGAAAWLSDQAHRGTVICPVGAAAVFAAKARLLDGYRCATHWRLFGMFAERFPKVTLTRDLFCMDGTRLTCAGGTAALDLTLTLIAREQGPHLAAAVAEAVLHTRIRPANDSQRMNVQWRYGVTDKRLIRAIVLMEQNLERPVPLAGLAAAAALSPRQFQRLFAARLGVPPGRFYLALRLNQARSLLWSSKASIFSIALDCGFSDASHFARHYRALFGETPGEIRK